MLTPDKIRYENGVKICEKIIPDSARATKYVASWVPKGSKMKPCTSMTPIGVTIHNTDDLKNVNDDAEQYTRATWPNCNMGGVVVHYYVDDLGAWQNLRENEPGWHASDGYGDGNTKTIAIECIMKGDGSAEDTKARDNTARLAASIMHRHGFSMSDLYTHNHWMGRADKIVSGAKKNCPIFLLPNWEGFKNLVQSYLSAMSKGTEEEVASSSSIKYEDIHKGDILQFNGTKQYPFSGISAIASNAKSGLVKVTNITKKTASHPIHVRSVDKDFKFISGVYGWVNLKDLSPATPYQVRVSKELNIRSGPGTSYKISGVIKKPGVFTIVEEKNGWGLLKSFQKSRSGWINLTYVTKL